MIPSIQAEGITPDFEIERCLPPTEHQQWLAKILWPRKRTAKLHKIKA